jgi:hypothetical protein
MTQKHRTADLESNRTVSGNLSSEGASETDV